MNDRKYLHKNVPLHAFYLIDGTSGISLYNINFSDRIFNEDMISGLFRAMEVFIANLAYKSEYGGVVKEITFGDMIIVFDRLKTRSGKLILGIIIAHKTLPPVVLHNLVKDGLDLFVKQYENYLGTFSVNIDVFGGFSNTFGNLIEKRYSFLLSTAGGDSEHIYEKGAATESELPAKIDYWLNIAKFAGMSRK